MSKIRIEEDRRLELIYEQIEKILNAEYSQSMKDRLLSRLFSRYGIKEAYDVRKIES